MWAPAGQRECTRACVWGLCVCTCTRERCSMWVWVHTCVSGCCVCVSPPAPRPSGHDCSTVCGETCVSTAAHTGVCAHVFGCVCVLVWANLKLLATSGLG